MIGLPRPWLAWTLRTKTVVVVLVPLAMLIASTSGVFWAARDTAKAEEEVRTVLRTLAQIHATHAQLAEAASGVRGYLLTGRDDFLQPYWRAKSELGRTLAQLDAQTLDPEQRSYVIEIGRLVSEKLENLEALRLRAQKVEPDQMQQVLVDNKRLLDRLRQQIAAMEQRVQGVIEQRSLAAKNIRERNFLITVLAATLGVASAVAAALLFANGITRRVRIIGENAARLARGDEPLPLADSGDELGQLAGHIRSAGALLAERAREAQEARREAESASQAKTQFLSRVSHELRTPLNAILGFAQVLEQDLHDQPARRSLEPVLAGGRHLLQLVNELLDISRIEAGALTLQLQTVALRGAIDEALAMTHSDAARRNIDVRLDPIRDDACVIADRQRLLQVLLNLLSNAVKFNRNGGSIRIDASREQDDWRIAIRDTGPGIEPIWRERLFTPFERLTAESIEGTGLGLAVSRSLVLAMHGRMGVDSTPGQGSTFWFALTAADAEQAQPPTVPGLTVGRLPPPSVADPLQRPRRLLYIEDNRSNQVLVETLVGRRKNWELRVERSGHAGLGAAFEQTPDLLLLDLQLPDLRGEDVLQALRANPRTARVPVIVLSADALPQTISRLRNAGAIDYLVKPLDVGRFYSAIDGALQQST